MTLTREEQIMVASMVVESHNISISEAKNNQELKEDLKLNLEFYSSIKQERAFINEFGFKDLLSLMGNIKDFWTAATESSTFFNFINNKVSKIIGKYSSQVSKYIPQSVKKIGAAVKAFASWLYKTFGYRGFAAFFARIKYKTLKPTEDQIKCLEPFAKIVVSILYISLVAFFLIKVITIIAGGSLATAAASGGVQMAGIQAPITALLSKVGGGNLLTGMFSTLSAYMKSKRAKEYADAAAKKLNSEKQNVVQSLIKNFKPAWNTCSRPTKESKLTLQQRIDSIY